MLIHVSSVAVERSRGAERPTNHTCDPELARSVVKAANDAHVKETGHRGLGNVFQVLQHMFHSFQHAVLQVLHLQARILTW